MRRILISTTIFLLLSITPVYAGLFGPAQPQTAPGQFSLGFGYTRYADEWNFTDFRNGGALIPGGITAKVRQNQIYLQVDFGLFRNWEVYLRGGFADLEVDNIMRGADFSDGLNPYATGGVKGLFARGRHFDLGGFAEVSYFHEFSDTSTQVRRFIVDEAIVVNAGFIFQREIEGALLYGGPFYHYREGDYWFVSDAQTFRGTVEDDSNVGGFLGIRWIALEDIVIKTEVQLRNRLSAGASISLVF